MAMRKVAAVDCGTNTLRLLVASRAGDGTLVEHARSLTFVGLGQGVDATRRLHPEAIERAFRACEEYAQIITEQQVDEIRFVATSAARDASNRDEFFDGVRVRLGVEPELISGDEEAQLSFSGALSGVPVQADPVLVMDSGGGSTELVLGTREGQITASISLDVGSRRVRERFLHSDPPTEEEISAARAFVRRLLSDSGLDLESVRTFIGVAGTITSMSAVAQGLAVYDRTKVHRSTMDRETVERVSDRLLSLTEAQVAALGSVSAERAHVLCAGALIVDMVARRVGSATLIVSESDILDGIALGMLAS